MTAFFSEDDLNAQKDALEWRGGKDPMSFTDEDLKRLKEQADGRPHFVQTETVLALITRLEAAENVFLADMTKDYGCACKRCVYHEKLKDAWHKAAGK